MTTELLQQQSTSLLPRSKLVLYFSIEDFFPQTSCGCHKFFKKFIDMLLHSVANTFLVKYTVGATK